MKYFEPVVGVNTARLLYFAGYSHYTRNYYQEFLKDVSYRDGEINHSKGDIVWETASINMSNKLLSEEELSEEYYLIYEACSLNQATTFLREKNVFIEIMIDKTLEPKCCFAVSLYDEKTSKWKSYESDLYKIEDYYKCWGNAIYFGLSKLDIHVPIEYDKTHVPVNVYSVDRIEKR